MAEPAACPNDGHSIGGIDPGAVQDFSKEFVPARQVENMRVYAEQRARKCGAVLEESSQFVEELRDGMSGTKEFSNDDLFPGNV